MTRPPSGDLDWASQVRRLAAQDADPDAVLFALTSASAHAWKLLLALDRRASVLDLGCGMGSRTLALRPFVASCHAVDRSLGALDVAARRPGGETANWIAVDDYAHLPFASSRFDLVVLPDWSEHPPPGEPGALDAWLREAGRVLAPGGQLFVLARNRFDYRRFADAGGIDLAGLWRVLAQHPDGAWLSLGGYRRRLRGAGFSSLDVYEAVRSRDFMAAIRPLQAPAAPWRASVPASLRQRIKQHRRLVPCFGIVAGDGSAPRPSALARLVCAARNELDRRGPAGALRMEHLEFSRKDKLLMFGRHGARTLVLRVPLNAQALVSEQRNASALREVESRGLALALPQTLAAGTTHGQAWFVESFVEGESLSRGLLRRGRETLLGEVQTTLRALNPAPADGAPLLSEARYAAAVGDRIEALSGIVTDPVQRRFLREYFQATLYGRRIPGGLQHGDFSASNLIVQGGAVKGLIDWESGDTAGVPALDAINYLDSVYRLAEGGVHPEHSIPALAARTSLLAGEREFLERYYAAQGIAEECHEALVYLKWLHHVSYLVRFWLQYHEPALQRFVFGVIAGLMRRH